MAQVYIPDKVCPFPLQIGLPVSLSALSRPFNDGNNGRYFPLSPGFNFTPHNVFEKFCNELFKFIGVGF